MCAHREHHGRPPSRGDVEPRCELVRGLRSSLCAAFQLVQTADFVAGAAVIADGLDMAKSAGSARAPLWSRDYGRDLVITWEPDDGYGLPHWLALSSERAEDREVLRSLGVSPQYWVHRARRPGQLLIRRSTR